MNDSSRRLLSLGTFDVETPAQVAFRMERAGLGTRCVAAIADTAFLALLYASIALAGVFVFGTVTPEGDAALALLGALILIMTFLFSAYYIAFEIAWNGQTPGKRLMGIRVVDDSGAPATPARIVIRNLVRIVDIQFGYGIGAVAIFATKEEKRLGDLAAGTVVVRDRPARPRA